MSTHTYPETSPTSPTQATIEPEHEAEPSADGDSANPSPFDEYEPPATFDTACTLRLPNTADGENKRVG